MVGCHENIGPALFCQSESSYNLVNGSRCFCGIFERGDEYPGRIPAPFRDTHNMCKPFQAQRLSPMYYDIYYVCIPHETLQSCVFFVVLELCLFLSFPLLGWPVLVKVMASGTRLPTCQKNNNEVQSLHRISLATSKILRILRKRSNPYSNY